MKKKKLLTICTLLLGAYYGFAQEVASSGGDYFENSSGSVSLTIGEPISETFSNSQTIATQGVQQSPLTIVSETDLFEEMGISIKVYPNPTSDKFQVEVSNPSTVSYILSNSDGKMVNSGNIRSSQVIPMSDYPLGIYVLSLTQMRKTRSIKIVKK